MNRVTLLGLSLLFASQIFAAGNQQTPRCLSNGVDLPVNNAQVLKWKKSTKNSFKERGHVKGPVSDLYSDRNGHAHFQIKIGDDRNDTLEVIYNEDFGALPDVIDVGTMVEACGDYITSIAQSGPYPASPDGGIIHWVHLNPRPGHPSGFLIIKGKVYGTDIENAGPKPRRRP